MQADWKWIFGSEKRHIGSNSNVAFKPCLPYAHELQGDDRIHVLYSIFSSKTTSKLSDCIRSFYFCDTDCTYLSCLSDGLVVSRASFNFMASFHLYNILANRSCKLNKVLFTSASALYKCLYMVRLYVVNLNPTAVLYIKNPSSFLLKISSIVDSILFPY
jgi:hypothetical protein